MSKCSAHDPQDVTKDGSCRPCRNERGRKYQRDNREARLEYQRQWHKDNKKKIQAYYRNKKYGLSDESFEQMFKEQNGLCAICQIKPAILVDHCHTTNKVRGLLCNPCNQAIGLFAENVRTIAASIVYLEK